MTDVLIGNPEPKPGSKYALVIAVAKRAKQLREGSPKLVDIKSRNHITIALEEIAQGLTKIHLPSPEEIEASERRDSVPKGSGARHAAEAFMAAEPDVVIVEDAEVSVEAEAALDIDTLLAVDVESEADVDEVEAEDETEDVEASDDIEPEETPEIESDDDDEPSAGKDE